MALSSGEATHALRGPIGGGGDSRRYEAIRACVMVNRNKVSTRVLIDRLLDGTRLRGYAVQPRNHHAVAAAIRPGTRGTLEMIASHAGLGFLPVQEERYDFVFPRSRPTLPAVIAFTTLLAQPSTSDALRRLRI